MTRTALTWAFAALAALTIAHDVLAATPRGRELAQSLKSAGHPSRPADVRCTGFAEEPTEFRCRYRLKGGRRCEAFIAADGPAWVLIDTPTCRSATG